MAYPSNNYPTSIQTTTDPVPSSDTATFDHAGLESFQNDSIVALKTKIGVNSSADNTSFDYKLSGVATGDKAVSKTGTETLTNKTLTAPVISGGTIGSATISNITTSGSNTIGGSNTYTGTNAFNTTLPTSSVTPSGNSDLTTKIYVDGQISSNVLPSQTSNNGKYLTTNGTSPSWSFPFNYTVASNTLQTSADTEQSSNSGSYVKVKEILCFYPGIYRIKFDLKQSSTSTTDHARIYKNGVAYGTIQHSGSTVYTTFSENLQIYAGDLIQLYIENDGSFSTTYVKNFRFYYDKTPYTTDVVVTN